MDRAGSRPRLRTAARSPPHLGDIVISVERAAEQAETGRGGQTGDVRWSAADELRLLATHGTLHICGWDHAEPAEETAMRALETDSSRSRDRQAVASGSIARAGQVASSISPSDR